ncbi:hypothetical protein GE061_014388 [Apolygus lucorum]|uniref:LRRCT domain-containing protein n=1 Tax=Apolygus lucorum TaxID=248454 RepID=A0A8S9XSI0_APOLU|nr:hypothetical protein GE061_014388 [Apolygus lucorum]
MGDGRRVLTPWIWLLLVASSPSPGTSICPSRCSCRDDTLSASCVDTALEVVPIQLNPDVEVIELSGNRIANVHYTLTFYTSLRILDVSLNKISSIGAKNFEAQAKLETLNASFNIISTLGKDAFRGLKSLKVLDLSHNQIESIEHGSFKDSHDIQTIDFSHNRITSFEDPTVFNSITSLRTLKLDHNQIIDVPSLLLKNLPSPCVLEKLTLNDNLIEVIEDKSFPPPCAQSMKVLTLGSNVIKEVEKSGFDSLHSLTCLDLSYNNLTYIPTQQLSKLNVLSELDLSGNTFHSVKPVAFQSLFQLATLTISRLPHLNWVDSRAFVDNIRLDTIHIDENPELRRIPTRIFHGNPHLSHVSLRSNALATVDVSHFPLDRLRSLDLSGNPLHCNCSLHWLWKLAQTESQLPSRDSIPLQGNETSPEGQPQLRIVVRNLKCSSPEGLKGQLVTEIPESTVRCETTWLTVAIITALVLALFGATCVVLLLFSSERWLCWCRKGKHSPEPEVDTRRLAPSLHPGSAPPPILMLMPDKHYRDAILSNYIKSESDMKLAEPWMNGDARQNDYSVDMTSSRSKPHIVYV